MSILIFSEPDDIHGALINLALNHKGYSSDLFFTADMPSLQTNSLYFSDSNQFWHTLAQDKRIDWYDKKVDSVWWRRPRKPYIETPLHPDDAIFARKENSVYHNSIPYLLNEDAWWVNPIESTHKTISKIVQLKIARSCGFKLPETLISNSAQKIKEFIAYSSQDEVIYKPFSPHYWVEEDGMRLLYTKKINSKELPSDALLQVSPGIYQKYVEKKYELRVTCFGSLISAVKINSQQHHLGQSDWRKIPGCELSLSPTELPETIQNKIHHFMKKMGIVFGCFDFIVTPEDEIIFLEVNEQGQFLWVEEILPEMFYMDMFAEFLLQRRFNFNWKLSNHTLSAKDFDDQSKRICDEQLNQHVYLNEIKKVS